jgi:hypothetical protein
MQYPILLQGYNVLLSTQVDVTSKIYASSRFFCRAKTIYPKYCEISPLLENDVDATSFNVESKLVMEGKDVACRFSLCSILFESIQQIFTFIFQRK